MLKERRTYPPEFKREAVELLKNSEKSAKEMAADLGIEANLLHRWKREGWLYLTVIIDLYHRAVVGMVHE